MTDNENNAQSDLPNGVVQAGVHVEEEEEEREIAPEAQDPDERKDDAGHVNVGYHDGRSRAVTTAGLYVLYVGMVRI